MAPRPAPPDAASTGLVGRLAPEAKVAATVLFVLAVVSTPREVMWAFAVDAVLVAAVALAAHLALGDVLRRMALELPFVVFALFLPFVGQGERTEVLGLSLSVAGLWGAWNILAKATLGVAASVVLASTTTVPDLLRGLDRLHVPKVITGIMGFMARYGEVIVDDLRRLRIARLARGDDPRWFWQARAVAATAGTLFVRSFERGERVHAAMRARGYDGTMPDLASDEPNGRDWWQALSVPALATVVAITAWLVR
jgi:cobalt/nickel transport system permease protein